MDPAAPVKPRGILPPHINKNLAKGDKVGEVARQNIEKDQEFRAQRREACKKDKR